MSTKILAWYDTHQRSLPWRRDNPNPYHVLLSEFMLQQTTVATVKAYFERFTTRWPNIDALAQAQDDDVMAEWAGLGYYARARNLLKAAREISAMDAFPSSAEELQKLPGVGPYTAAAIAAIAFNHPILPRDGNINRILARVHNIDDAIDRPSEKLTDAATHWAHPLRAGELAQAMMDIGSAICRPKNPDCENCPINDTCEAKKSGRETELPIKAPKRAKKIWKAHAYVLRKPDGAIGYVMREPSELLGGMWALPTSTWEKAPKFSPPIEGEWKNIGEIRHIFTHIDLTMSVHVLDIHEEIMSNVMSFKTSSDLPKTSLARLWGKVLEKLAQTRDN